MASPFNFVEGFAVSVPSAFLASLFISFYVSNCLTSLRASPLSLRCLNAFGVSRFAVSVPSVFLASLFISFYVSNCLTSLRASPFKWLRRF